MLLTSFLGHMTYYQGHYKAQRRVIARKIASLSGKQLAPGRLRSHPVLEMHIRKI
jgi:hypothetical protein